MARKAGTENTRMRLLQRKGPKSQPRETSFSLIKNDPTSSPETVADAWIRAARAALQIPILKELLLYDPVRGEYFLQPAPVDWVDPVVVGMQRTFEMFKLDPADPWSWQMLARYLSMIYFWELPRNKRGRPQKWTPELLLQLGEEAAKSPGLPVTKIAKRLAGDKKSPFYDPRVLTTAGVEGLRKQLRKAKVERPRKPKGRVGTK